MYCAKNYRNWLAFDKVIAKTKGAIFLRHSVVARSVDILPAHMPTPLVNCIVSDVLVNAMADMQHDETTSKHAECIKIGCAFKSQCMLHFHLHFLPDFPKFELLTFAR